MIRPSPRSSSFWDWLGAHLPDEPCWFLDLVGVAPAAQGAGLGKALVRHGLQRRGRAGAPAFVEPGNPRNLPLHQSLGFQTVSKRTLGVSAR